MKNWISMLFTVLTDDWYLVLLCTHTFYMFQKDSDADRQSVRFKFVWPWIWPQRLQNFTDIFCTKIQTLITISTDLTKIVINLTSCQVKQATNFVHYFCLIHNSHLLENDEFFLMSLSVYLSTDIHCLTIFSPNSHSISIQKSNWHSDPNRRQIKLCFTGQ